MKTLSIFNEKGGTGKTTLSAMLADYLCYEKGEPVRVFDMDAPSFHFQSLRNDDKNILEGITSSDGSFIKAVKSAGKEPYPIVSWDIKKHPASEIIKVVNELRSPSLPGYCIFDFSGSYDPADPAHIFICNGLLDMLAIPVDTDSESSQSAFYLAKLIASQLKDAPEIKRPITTAFWNRIFTNDEQRAFSSISTTSGFLEMMGITVLNTKVRSHRSLMSRPRSLNFLRQTMCYPASRVRSYCPSLEEFFDELLSLLNQPK